MGMANLIDRDSLMAQLEDRQAFLVKEWGYRDHYTRGFEEAVDKVEDQPTVDAVEVVRCRDCKHCMMCYPLKEIGKEAVQAWYCKDLKSYRKPDDFCSYGERKYNG